MLLKKLIVSGFKSFADRVTLSFGSGITGIVGPNGSGKSNVIDSVRWVMGEQNAKNLRGETATDIIFAGSDKRKSLGMAEVTLVFDNSDQSPFCPPEYRMESEIALTRRLYIDGSREYLINRKPCRLKDIVGFFATTGLGGRSYSMIQQGQVDRILNAKPEEIREILEEAAGTAVFKARRIESQKRLDATRENLTRVDDVVVELVRQLDSLKAQVEKAGEWRELNAALREKELSVLAHNYQFFSREQNRLEQELSGETDKEVELMAAIARNEARNEELQSLLQRAFPEVDALQEEIAAVREQQSRADILIISSIETREKGGMRVIQMEGEIAKEAEDLEALEQDAARATEELASTEATVNELKDKIEAFQDEVDHTLEAARVYINKIEEIEDEIRNLQRLLENNKMLCEANERDRGRIALELKEGTERLEILERELEQIVLKEAEAEALVKDSRSGLDVDIRLKSEHELRNTERQAQLTEFSRRRDTAKESYFDLRARLKSLLDVEANSGDVRQTIQTLKAQNPEALEKSAMLADLVSFSEAAVELPQAATAVFERWAERLVVPTLPDVNALVQALAQQDLGGIAVSVLTATITLDPKAVSAFVEATDAEPMARFLQAESAGPNVSQFLDGLYFLPALALDAGDQKLIPPGLTVFTAKGVIVSGPDHFFIGQRKGRGILSRRAEAETMAHDLKQAERDLAQAQGEIDRLVAEQNESLAILREVEERLRGQNKDVLAVMAQHQSMAQLKSHKEELIRDIKKKLVKFEESDREYKKQLEQLGQTRIALGGEKETLLQDNDSLKAESGSLEDQQQEVNRIQQNMRLDLAKAESRHQTLRDNFGKSRSLLERMQGQISRRYADRARIDQEMEQAKILEASCRREAEALVLRREELEERLAVERESSSDLHEEQRAVEKKVRIVRETLSAVQNAKSNHKVAGERFRIALSGIIGQATEKYQLDIATWPQPTAEDFDPDRTTKDVNKIRRKIEELGAVNMVAIEEYEQLSQRHQFTTTQRDEILAAIQVIEEAIAEVDLSAKERFLQTFELIHKNFTELFPILFPNGEGRLELGNPDDPLNSPVEIMVRLPGKKPGRMSLFSGGEKALTAISLIFALLKTKPTPFCFLDEVDAPLDEANVGRYNAVLEALSSRFQFIVITHNRRTMEVLDQLYGVTMQEGGVSKVVGVDLKKDLPVHLQKAFKEEKTKVRHLEGATVAPHDAAELE